MSNARRLVGSLQGTYPALAKTPTLTLNSETEPGSDCHHLPRTNRARKMRAHLIQSETHQKCESSGAAVIFSCRDVAGITQLRISSRESGRIVPILMGLGDRLGLIGSESKLSLPGRGSFQ